MKTFSKSYTRKFSPKIEIIILIFCLAATILFFMLSLFTGAAKISAGSVWQWLILRESNTQINNIMLYVRLPRSIAALVCGAALALSGLLLQSALHNPLASAGTIGINSGAGLFAVLASAMFPGVFAAKPAFAFIGALFAAFFVFVVSQKVGASKSTIIMAGVAIGSLFSAGTDTIVTIRPDSVIDKTSFFIGGFSGVLIGPVLFVIPIVTVGFLVAVFLSPRLNILSLGDEVAASLGLHVHICRVMTIFCAALLAAGAVCIGGLLGFVGLIVPHAARFIIGYDHRRLVPFTALLGGSLVIICDILARILFSPYELPVGILLSLLGAPFFLALILHRRSVQ